MIILDYILIGSGVGLLLIYLGFLLRSFNFDYDHPPSISEIEQLCPHRDPDKKAVWVREFLKDYYAKTK